MKVAFLPCGDSEVELLESTEPDGPIARFIEKNGPGIQHIAIRVDDIDKALEELKAKDQMAWVARMNSLKNQAEEMIFSELIFA